MVPQGRRPDFSAPFAKIHAFNHFLMKVTLFKINCIGRSVSTLLASEITWLFQCAKDLNLYWRNFKNKHNRFVFSTYSLRNEKLLIWNAEQIK